MTQKAYDSVRDLLIAAGKSERTGDREGVISSLREAASSLENHGLEDASQPVWDLVRKGKRDTEKELNLYDEINTVRWSDPVQKGLKAVKDTSEADDPSTKRAKDKEEEAVGDKQYADKQKEIRALARFRKAKAARMQRALEVGKRGGKFYTIAGGKKVYVKE